jgi:hypothetical protein
VPLRGGSVRRRPGESAPGPQLCLCPTSSVAAGASRSRARRPSYEMLYEAGVSQGF